MTAKREALLGRYRARSLDRLRQVGLSLAELGEGRGGAGLLEQVARELHTFKGDSRVVGLDALAELAHAAESVLLSNPAGPPGPSACARIAASLEVAVRVLREELAEDAAGAALAAESQSLAAGAEPAKAPAPEAAPPRPAGVPAERWMWVKASRVDEICERVSELSGGVRALMLQLSAKAKTGADAAELRALAEMADLCRSRLDDAFTSAWSLRLVPIQPALEEMIGYARALGESQGKRVRVEVRNDGAEVERSVLDALQEPLLHLVRNAVDHGLERPEERRGKPPEGTLTLRAVPAGPNLLLEVSDDGRGVDLAAVRETAAARGLLDRASADALGEREALELLFHHGFTTRREVSEISGRGVGLDVVRERLDALGGSAEIATRAGAGTTVKLTAPSSITREKALVVECAGNLYGFSSGNVLEVLHLAERERQAVAGGSAFRFRNEAIPLSSLAQLLGAPPVVVPWTVVLEAGSRRWGVAVSTLVGEREVLRRPVDALLSRFDYLAASATLDDGRLVLLLSPAALLRRQEAAGAAPVSLAAPPEPRARRVLVVDDSLTVCDLVSELLVEAGFEVCSAGDGQAALALIRDWMPDLVLVDIDMPVMDGFELLQRVRSCWRHLPVVMLTTRGSPDDRRRAASLGASAYLVKSRFEEATLVETVRRFLGVAPP